jgi:hypothetical protein
MRFLFQRPFWLTTQTVTRTRLTWKAWAMVWGVLGLAVSMWVPRWHGWLAVSRPVSEGAATVLEGWSTDAAARLCADEWKARRTPVIWTTGIPVDRGSLLVEWKNFAYSSEATLEKMGVAPEAAIAVPTPDVATDRTLASAQALKPLLEAAVAQGQIPPRLRIVTMGVHARRTLAVYERVFGPGWEIGISALSPAEYQADRWWAQSNGVKAVIIETIAVMYDWVR